MTDNFAARSELITSPGRNAFTITPHATNEISPLPRSVRFDGAGTVALRTVDGAADISITVAAGETLDWRIQYIRATGTTATGIVGIE